ncbi:MAG: DUF2017 family protein [Actinomycetota bacterium]
MNPPFTRKRGGSIEMRVGEAEAEILGQVVGELRDQLSMPDRPQHLWRLFPPAYKDDANAQAEYARFTEGDLANQRLGALESVSAALSRGRTKHGAWITTLDEDDVHALLGVLNDARLALGTRLDVTEELDEESVDQSNEFAFSVYQYLGWLQSFLVDALLDSL